GVGFSITRSLCPVVLQTSRWSGTTTLHEFIRCNIVAIQMITNFDIKRKKCVSYFRLRESSSESDDVSAGVLGSCTVRSGDGGDYERVWSSSRPISVNLSPSSSVAIDQSQTVGITANVMNDASVKGVSWTLTGPGSLSNSTALSVTYNT